MTGLGGQTIGESASVIVICVTGLGGQTIGVSI